MLREHTRQINVGGVPVGGGAGVSVQSMTNTKTEDADATADQIARLKEAGCDIVRVAVPNMDAARAIAAIKAQSSLPIVADIHFDHELAIAAVKAGADKIRVNPGNIGGADKVRAVAAACMERGVPIRVGVNGGSLQKGLEKQYNGDVVSAMVHSAMEQAELLESFGFRDICVSLKASDVPTTVSACRKFAERSDLPLHLGVTEAGTTYAGTIRSAAGIGALLLDGIGDTIRVSLTADPVEEVRAGIELLKAVGLRGGGVKLISCPSCGRCGIDLVRTAREVEDFFNKHEIKQNITVAVMGCAVNGPGEARHADYGLCGATGAFDSARGRGDGGFGLLFKKGEIVRKVPENELVRALVDMVLTENRE